MPDEVSLREHLETLVTLEVKRLEVVIHSLEEAVAIAREVFDVRLDAMNHLREEFNEQKGKFVDRVLYDERHAALEKTMNEMSNRIASNDGMIKALLALLALGGAAIALLEFFRVGG